MLAGRAARAISINTSNLLEFHERIFMYSSRNGFKYYLHETKTKTGKLRYTFSKKKEDSILSLPEGYEIYEPPNGNVVLRKKIIKTINNEEKAIIERELNIICKGADYIIDEKNDGLSIYVDEQYNKKIGIVAFSMMTMGCTGKIYYEPTFRISKINNEYRIERFCFLGSIEDWVFLKQGSSLKAICKKYFVHINKESFYELM
jgi:hypothetical protein